MDFENSKYAAQFPFPQLQNTSLVPNATPLIYFSLNMLATGRVESTIRISVVTQPLNFPFFNRHIGPLRILPSSCDPRNLKTLP